MEQLLVSSRQFASPNRTKLSYIEWCQVMCMFHLLFALISLLQHDSTTVLVTNSLRKYITISILAFVARPLCRAIHYHVSLFEYSVIFPCYIWTATSFSKLTSIRHGIFYTHFNFIFTDHLFPQTLDVWNTRLLVHIRALHTCENFATEMYLNHRVSH